MRKLNFGSAFRERKTGRQRHSHCPISSHSPIIIEIVPDIPAPPTHVHFIVDTTPSPLDQLLRGLAAPPRALPLTLRCCCCCFRLLACFLSSQQPAAAGLTRKRVLPPRTPIQSHSRRATKRPSDQPSSPRYHGLHRQRRAYPSSRRPRARRRPCRQQAKARTQRTLHRPRRAPVANSKRHSGHCQRVCAVKKHIPTSYADLLADTTPSHPSFSTHSATPTPPSPHTKSKGSRPLAMTKRRRSSTNCVTAHTLPCHSSRATPCT